MKRNLVLMIVLFVAASLACDGGCGCGAKKEEIPAEPIGRVEQMSETMPKATESIVFISDLEEMREDVDILEKQLPDTGVVDTLQKQIQKQFGIDILDEESWKQAGVAADSGMSLSMYRSRVILMIYVENRQQFEKILTEKVKNAFEIDAVTKAETVGNYQMKVLSENPAKQIAWMYRGKMALVSLPATNAKGAIEEGTATLVLGEVANTKKEESLGSTKEFAQFKDAVATKYPVSIYLATKAYLDREEVQAQIKQDSNAAAAYSWTRQNVDYLAGGIRAESDEAVAQVLMGTNGEFAKKAQELQKNAKKRDWSSFATDKVLLGLRTAIDFQQAWALAMDSMPDDARRGFRRNVKQVGSQFGVDTEEDLLAHMTGNLAVFFYGIAGNPMQMMNAGPAQIARKTGLMVAIEFDSAKSIDQLFARLVPGSSGALKPSKLEIDGQERPGFHVYDLVRPAPYGSFYTHENTVLFATTAFGHKAVWEYFENKRDDEKLADVEGFDLGEEFASGERFSGLYFNSRRAQATLGSMLSLGGTGQILQSIEEAQLGIDAVEEGLTATLELDFAKSMKESGDSENEQNQK